MTQPDHLSLRIMSMRSVSHNIRIIYQKPKYSVSHTRILSFYSIRVSPVISLSINLQDDLRDISGLSYLIPFTELELVVDTPTLRGEINKELCLR